MMKTNRSRGRIRHGVIAAGLLLAVAGISYSADAPVEEWKAPARATRKPNPIPSTDSSIAAGKKVYAANCVACHGTTGKGDGPAANAITPKPRDLSNPAIQSQTDGSIFWKITEGKKPMPTFDKLIAEPDRWNVINYVRTFGAKGGK